MMMPSPVNTAVNTDSLFESMIRVENKDIFIDLKRNQNGVYLKISERRNGTGRNTVLIPSSGIQRLKAVFDEISKLPLGPAIRYPHLYFLLLTIIFLKFVP